MSNESHVMIGTGEGDVLSDASQFSQLHYVELDIVTDHPAIALQLTTIMGVNAVPFGSVHPNHAFLTSQRYTIERWINQTKTPISAIVRVDYLPSRFTPTDIIGAGWELLFDFSSRSELRRFDINGEALGPDNYDAVPPGGSAIGPIHYFAEGGSGRIPIGRTKKTIDEPRDVLQPSATFSIRKELKRAVTEDELILAANYSTKLNSNVFVFPKRQVMFRSLRVNYQQGSDSNVVSAGRATDDPFGIVSNVELVFEWRDLWDLFEIEQFTDDEGFSSSITAERVVPVQGEPTVFTLTRTRVLYREANFQTLIAQFV